MWERSSQPLPVTCPFDNSEVGATWLAGDAEFERATSAAVEAAAAMRRLPAYERAAILMRAHADLVARREEIGRTIAGEVGKALRDALAEADRGTQTFQVAAEEARRIGGEVIPMDLAPHGVGRVAFTRRYPIGPVAGISPFNFPFNLTAHKIAPAVAAGDPIVLKPATKTPLSALILADALDRAGLPKGALSVLPMSRQIGDRLVTDERYKLLTFTGSSAVGWSMKARAGKKKVLLELGGNAGVIVDETADIELRREARRHRRLLARRPELHLGAAGVRPRQRCSTSSPAASCARRRGAQDWQPARPGHRHRADDRGGRGRARRVVGERRRCSRGRRVLTGGRRIGPALYAPTVLVDVPETAKVCAQEVFAPVVGLYRFDRVRRRARAASTGRRTASRPASSRRDLCRTLDGDGRPRGRRRHGERRVGLAHRPHAVRRREGLGLGREGPRYAIEEMTEQKIVVINRERYVGRRAQSTSHKSPRSTRRYATSAAAPCG